MRFTVISESRRGLNWVGFAGLSSFLCCMTSSLSASHRSLCQTRTEIARNYPPNNTTHDRPSYLRDVGKSLLRAVSSRFRHVAKVETVDQ